MKKYFFFILSFFLIAAVGCSNSHSEEGNMPPETKVEATDSTQDTTKSEPEPDAEPTPPKTANAEELRQLFEQAYTTGNSRSQEPEQIAAEFSVIQELAFEIPLALPSDTEVQYIEWRNMTIAAIIEAENDMLKASYNKLIADCTRYDERVAGLWESTPGLFYADRMDFDGDGVMELLLAYLERKSGVDGEPDCFADVTVEVYGNDPDGSAIKYGEFKKQWDFGDKWLKIFTRDDKLYIGGYSWGGGSGLPATYIYYGVENGLLKEIESYSSEDAPGEELSKYTEICSLIAFHEGYPAQISFASGVLPELPSLSLVLNGTSFELGDTPVINNGYILAPVPALEKLGLAVHSEDVERWLVSTKHNTLWINMWDFPLIYFDNDFQNFADDMEVIDGKLFVPIEPIAALFGGKVERVRESNVIAIDLSIPVEDRMNEDEIKALHEFQKEDAFAILERAGYELEHKLELIVTYQFGDVVWSIKWLPSGQEEIYYSAKVSRNGIMSINSYGYDPAIFEDEW